MAAKFVPRAVFPHLDSIPRSYFLGHHRAGLEKMKKLVTDIDLVIECRDFRIPACSINPMFEEALGEKERLILYTKRDLGGDNKTELQRKERAIQRWDRPSTVMFVSKFEKLSLTNIIKYLRIKQQKSDGITGTRAMVVGMPNVGKSTLINHLRSISLNKGKAAQTGAQPGITRKVGTAIKIVERTDGSIYVVDTPGVFVPYMPDAESMLKLALCGSVKDTVIPITVLADYLLYHMNLYKPGAYAHWSEPTNEIMPFLERVSVKSGRLSKGGIPNLEAAALWFIQRWRNGDLGAFMLDDVSQVTAERKQEYLESFGGSMNQARKAMKKERAERSKVRLGLVDKV